MSFLRYIGYTDPTMAVHVLHNLHRQLSQCHDLFFSLNVDRDGISLIYVRTKFPNSGALKILSLDQFLLSFC